jgi:hypothetical protein
MINSDSDPESLLVSDSKLGLGIPDDLGLGIHDEHGLGESINPDFNLAFLQVLDLESMINSDSDPESLLVSDSQLGLGIPADLGLRIHDEHGLGESINPEFNLAFLQVLDPASMINSDLDPGSLLVSDSKLGLGIPADLGLGIHEPRLGLGMPAGLGLGMDLESMNPDSDLESMINSDLGPESLLVLDSKLGLGIPADLGLRIYKPRLELGIPACLGVTIHEPRPRLGIQDQLGLRPGIPASLGLKTRTWHPC